MAIMVKQGEADLLIIEALLRLKARKERERNPGAGVGLLDFTIATFPRYTPAKHHLELIRALEAVERGEIKRLMVFMPPRHGKSELASIRFPAWYIGRNPNRKVIASSYGSGMANKFSRRTRNLIQSPTYQRTFPDVRVAGDAAAVQFWAIDGKDGQYSAAGVGGGITGEGADLLLIDDPVKDGQDAMSLTVREGTWEWYTSTAYTRLNDMNGAIVLIMTRWHTEDLAGLLLQEASDGGEQWHVIRFPAIAEDHDPLGREAGEPLWPERFPLERLQEIQRVEEPRGWWSALYQQTPPEALGGRYFRSFSPRQNGLPWHVWTEAEARTHYNIPETRTVERNGVTVTVDQPFPPVEWQKWASVDGGVRDQWCTHYWTRVGKRVFLYREFYGSNVQVPEQAKKINATCERIGDFSTGHEGDTLAVVKCDPSMFNKRANIGVSDAEIYRQNGVPLWPAYNHRIMGWRRLLEALEPLDDGYPGLVILDGAAPNLVRTLPRLTADPLNPEDIEDGQEDHAADCARYGINPAAAQNTESTAYVVNARVDAAMDTAPYRPGEPSREPAYVAELGQTGFTDTWR